MDARGFARAVGPLARRITGMLARGSVTLSSAAGKMQRLQVRLLAGEAKQDVEHLEPYGYTANPLPGAEVLAAFLDGDRSHGVVVVVADRRFRLQGLAPGEVALYTDQGDKLVFRRGGTLEIVAATKVSITSPLVEMSGNLRVLGNITAVQDIRDQDGAKSMAGMRTVYNTHDHTETGGTTLDPNQLM